MKIEMNDKGIFVDDEKIDGDDVRITSKRSSFASGNVVRVNDHEITGFWGGCIALVAVTFTFACLALMFATPFLVLIGIGWLIAQAMHY